MTVYEIEEQIEIQCEIQLCHYDYEMEERILLENNEANRYRKIKYMYIENDILFLELDDDI